MAILELKTQAMSVVISDMKTLTKAKPAKKPAPKTRKAARSAKGLPAVFTVRDLNRNSQTVLSAARQHGRVTIRSRSGERFTIETMQLKAKSAGPRPDLLERLRQHQERLRALGCRPPSPTDQERLNRIIAGEE